MNKEYREELKKKSNEELLDALDWVAAALEINDKDWNERGGSRNGKQNKRAGKGKRN